jgi:hypothetical protein
MADNYLTGKQGSVSTGDGSVKFAFGKWHLTMRVELPNITNISGAMFQQLAVGIVSATVTVTGPYNANDAKTMAPNMPFTVGVRYVWWLRWSDAIFIVVGAIVESIDPEVDVEDGPKIAIVAQSDGVFLASIDIPAETTTESQTDQTDLGTITAGGLIQSGQPPPPGTPPNALGLNQALQDLLPVPTSGLLL